MIHWKLENRKISSLKPHPKNPRTLSIHDAEHLQKSLDKFGLIDKPIITDQDLIIGGHQRIALLKKNKVKEIECWVPDQPLTEKDIDELNIRLNRATGEWDFDTLGNEWEINDLLEWGFLPEELSLGIDENIKEEEISLPDGEKGMGVISFSVTEEQRCTILEAIKKAKEKEDFPVLDNENSNGNSIYKICCAYLVT